jgi:hypothetical protein
MKLHGIKYLIVGMLLVTLIVFSAMGIYNVIIYKIPVIGPEIPNPYPKLLNTYSLPANYTSIALDDPVRETLLTEDQAWGYTWKFLQQEDNFKIFLPMEKSSGFLKQITDGKGNKYQVWAIYVRQNSFKFLQDETRGGTLYVDAHDGRVLWYDPFL